MQKEREQKREAYCRSCNRFLIDPKPMRLDDMILIDYVDGEKKYHNRENIDWRINANTPNW